MIMSQTPFRVSLFGGGTDYPAWYREHGGAVLGATINKFCYISIRTLPPFFAHRHRIVYSRIELPQSIAQIEHPAVRAVLAEQRVSNGVEVQYHGDMPASSGIGSSSSFTTGLLRAVWAYHGLASSPERLARETIRIEQEVIGESVGSQDQIWAAFGGLNRIAFHPDGAFAVTPLVLDRERIEDLQAHLMLVFTGLSRNAPIIARQQILNIGKRQEQLHTIREIVDEAYSILLDATRPIVEIGHLLDATWRLKKELADPISNSAIDEIYAAAVGAGATGGKLLGAGGGGFMLLVVHPDRRESVRERLRGLTEVAFKLGTPGSRIVICEPDLEVASD
jgi:D-glycero-alpha-D-manno-heptose-7-phosphate kinase